LIVETVTEELEEGQEKSGQDQNAKLKTEDEVLLRELEYYSFFDNIPDKFMGKNSFFF
jgi:hypothetical protein